ncbi:putative methyltransferase YcgJ [Methyloligella halotolerans]|uniref:Putative methyltransferase YcgJ n=1 Tax=Methyloligella halotolerans TaxID=1177755 RepID=A0A1E2S071_9HYPH|nr:class I SAM-dependent methyltransferase [Methyloligella halotolerans]ODA67725.1 putative methyltransferase YcgJ [Methyloligella halotolerans]
MRAKQILMDTDSVLHAYRRWAPVYDTTFGKVAAAGRKHAVEMINRREGRVLEVGVGTGLSLPAYRNHLKVTGIDLSPEMLSKARDKVERLGLDFVEELHEMDATNLEFPDDSFDTVVAMYVMTVVPDPEKVMAELERVCAPGGEVILVNHFSQEDGFRGWFERRMAPLADQLGWHPVFPVETVLVRDDLRMTESHSLRPCGLFTMLRFTKEPGYGLGRTTRAMPMKRRSGRRSAQAAVARLAMQGRKMTDIRYWRSLRRRLSSQGAD